VKRTVTVLTGGESRERDVARVTGAAVAKALAGRGHRVTLLDTREGEIRLEDANASVGAAPPDDGGAPGNASPTALVELVARLAGADVVFPAFHGGWGEDGTLQALLDLAGIPYTGSGVLASALAMDKDRAKRVLASGGIPVPDSDVLEIEPGTAVAPEVLAELRARRPGKLVVKPNAEGSTVGLTVVEAGEDPAAAVAEAARYDSRVLVEEFVEGRELTVGILGREALPVVEIVAEGGLYTYEAKYTKGKSRYEAPARLPEALADTLRRESLRAFDLLGCEGFGRVDWRLRPDGSHACLEANTIPGMTPLSLVPMAAGAVGMDFGELVERIVELGIARGARRGRRPAGRGAAA
jgi:D-alanine-D-alanine ligase